MAIGPEGHEPFVKLPQSQYWWQSALVYSEASSTSLQVQHGQQPTTYTFVFLSGNHRSVTGKTEIGLHGIPFLEIPETTHQKASFWTTPVYYLVSPTNNIPKGNLNR